MKTSIDFKHLLRSYFIIALGSILYGLAYDWFYAPNFIAMGGLTGLAQVINVVFPFLPVGIMVFAMNVPLFFLGWKYIGGHLLLSSLFSMAVSSFAIDLIAMIPFQPQDPMLATVFGGALMGLSLGLVFSQNATTGGTDIITRLIKLKAPWLNLGTIMLGTDFVVITLAAITFGQIESAFYGLISLFICTRVMDMVLYGSNSSKIAYIISEQHEAIAQRIVQDLDRGLTILHGKGGYSNQDKQVLMVAFPQKEIVQIKALVHELDEPAFLIVCDAHDVLGEGFRTYDKNEL